jgi:hypothetical protein
MMLKPNATIAAKSADLSSMITEFLNNGGQIIPCKTAAAGGVKKPKRRV